MNKIYGILIALVLSFSLGSYTTSKYIHGQYAQAELVKRNELNVLEEKLRSEEVLRLNKEAEIDYNLGVVLDEVRSDPDGGNFSLSLRATERLNRIR